MHAKGRVWLFAGVAFCVTTAVYLRSSRFDFINLDDYDYVMNNSHMVDGLTPGNVTWAFVNPDYASNWHPLAWTSMMADVSMMRAYGIIPENWNMFNNPVSRVMHLHNVLLHAANSALLFILLVIISRNRLDPLWPLLFTLLWSVHPLRVEVVCWVSERKELVSVFWMLLSLIFYTRRKAHYLLALLFAVFAMLAKPVAVTLPAVILAWDWVICGKPRWLRVLPFAAFSLFTCFMTMRAQTAPIALGNNFNVSGRLMCIFGAPAVYLRQTVWPAGLSLLYGNTEGIVWPIFLPGVLITLCAIIIPLCWLFRTRHSALGTSHSLLSILTFGVAWVYVGLIPMLGIVKVAGEEHSDRYTYWIGCGAAAIAIMLIDYLKSRRTLIGAKLAELSGSGKDELSELRKAALVVLVAFTAILAIACDRRVIVWKDALTINRDSMEKSLDPFLAAPFGNWLVENFGAEGRKEAEYWLRGCANRWKSPVAYFALGRFLLTKPLNNVDATFDEKPYAEAEWILRTVLDMDPNHQEAKELLERIEKIRKEVEKK